jgi:release factor glutamine methyltransferase
VTTDQGELIFRYRGCEFAVADGVQPPKAGSLLFCRHLHFLEGEHVLEIGAGTGLAAVLAARAGCRVVATDVVPEAVDCVRGNAARNGVGDRVEVLQGDCYEPVAGRRFDLICASPPQMPTPPGRERDDAAAAADNGGVDGWDILDRLIAGAPAHLVPGGRLVFTLFAFLGPRGACARLEAAGLEASILARETHAFPRIGYERLEHIRGLDTEGALPVAKMPTSVDRLVMQGRTKPR